jgi:hypothetical protein
MKFGKRVLLVGLMLTFVLALTGCGGGGGNGPADVAKKYIEAMADLDADKLNDYSCEADQIPGDVDLNEAMGSAGGSIKFKDMKYEVVSEEDDTAIVRMSGKMEVEMAGQSLELELDQFEMLGSNELVLVKEGGDWKVCRSME